MILLFSETRSDYSKYLYPYVIWALPETGERPADLFRHGFLPASAQLDRFYLCRNIRVDLGRYRLNSENRRILRKGVGITAELQSRAAFEFTEARRQAWKAFADRRFGEDVMSFARLDGLMTSPVINHLLVFRDAAAGREVGVALLYLEPLEVAYYYYAFYDLAYRERNLGMYMMTWAVDHFARSGYRHAHLGTCYSERALYKTQFQGVEFFNGHRWSANLEELRFLIRRDTNEPSGHLLEMQEYHDLFGGGLRSAPPDGSTFRLTVS